jgi:hypothetical protein
MIFEKATASGVAFAPLVRAAVKNAYRDFTAVCAKAAVHRGEVSGTRPGLAKVINFNFAGLQIGIFERDRGVANHAAEVGNQRPRHNSIFCMPIQTNLNRPDPADETAGENAAGTPDQNGRWGIRTNPPEGHQALS